MNQIVTTGIILNRINYGEADRILTLLTPDHGKIRLMAKGVRKQKSKLAGGIELFSISTITYIAGRGDIGTLVSTRLVTYYSTIVQNMQRTRFGYDILKAINKVTQDQCEPDFYQTVVVALNNLDNPDVPLILIEVWFYMRLLKLLGHQPNLQTDVTGRKLQSDRPYAFDFEAMAFGPAASGTYTDRHIKILRLLLAYNPEKLIVIGDSAQAATQVCGLLKNLLQR